MGMFPVSVFPANECAVLLEVDLLTQAFFYSAYFSALLCGNDQHKCNFQAHCNFRGGDI